MCEYIHTSMCVSITYLSIPFAPSPLQVTRQLTLATVTLTGAISSTETTLLSGLNDTTSSVTDALTLAESRLNINLGGLGATLSGVVETAKLSLGSRVDLFNDNILTNLRQTLETLSLALNQTNSVVSQGLSSTAGDIANTTAAAAAILAQVRILISNLNVNLR